MKYKSLQEFVAAAESGELPDGSALMVDNDNCTCYGPEDENMDQELLFAIHPQTLLEEALNILGVPWGFV